MTNKKMKHEAEILNFLC